jgi:hypothetical protein
MEPGANGWTENELGIFSSANESDYHVKGIFWLAGFLHDAAYAASADGWSLWLALRLLSRSVSDVKLLATKHVRNQESHFLLVRLDTHYKNV